MHFSSFEMGNMAFKLENTRNQLKQNPCETADLAVCVGVEGVHIYMHMCTCAGVYESCLLR